MIEHKDMKKVSVLITEVYKNETAVSRKKGSGTAKVKTSATLDRKTEDQHQNYTGSVTGDLRSGVSKKNAWTIEDEMARKIQTAYRGYRCRNTLLNLKKKKAEYDELMENLQREAYQKLCKLQREEEKEERKRLENERKKQMESANRIRRMLEAAFDGEVLEIKRLLSDVSALHPGEQKSQQYELVECTDPNGNTPLSEAAAGGNPDIVRLLIDLGADPNRKGQYGRTPLYRAAFCGHLEAAKILLELGADPRICADDGAIPEQVSSNASLTEVFQQWDITITEHMVKHLEGKFAERRLTTKRLQEAEESKIEAKLEKADKEYSSKQRQLSKAYEELNKRIHEHDEHGHMKGEVTLQAVHDAENILEIAKLQTEEARKKLQKMKLQMRIMRKNKGVTNGEENEQVNVSINIRELDDVLMKDVGNKILESGKWPLLIDAGEQAATFLRYRDTNYLNICNPRHMEPEAIRMAILGAMRYGKFAVLDLLDIEDMWHVVEQKFDGVQKNLLSDLMSKELFKEEKYLALAKPSDGEEYSSKMFIGARIQNFKFVILTQLPIPPKELLSKCYVIKIHTPTA